MQVISTINLSNIFSITTKIDIKYYKKVDIYDII